MDTPEAGKRPFKLRVLVSDDERAILQTLARVLALTGCEICALYSGSTTARILQRFRPELLVTNIAVPGCPAVSLTSLNDQRIPAFRILLFAGDARHLQMLTEGEAEPLSFEVLRLPIGAVDLKRRLHGALKAEQLALMVPLEISAGIH